MTPTDRHRGPDGGRQDERRQGGRGLPHLPNRPEWICRVDGRRWPCRAARRALRKQFLGDRAGLTAYMAGCLTQAVRELPEETPRRLARRFMAWTRRW